jgi:hypothetical protein
LSLACGILDAGLVGLDVVSNLFILFALVNTEFLYELTTWVDELTALCFPKSEQGVDIARSVLPTLDVE